MKYIDCIIVRLKNRTSIKRIPKKRCEAHHGYYCENEALCRDGSDHVTSYQESRLQWIVG